MLLQLDLHVVVAQILGLGGMAFGLATWQASSRERLLAIQAASSSLWAASYLLLHAYPVVMSNASFAVVIAVLWRWRRHPWHRRSIAVVGLAAYFLPQISYELMSGWPNLVQFGLVSVAEILYFGSYTLTEKWFRAAGVCNNILYAANNIFAGSIVGLASNTASMISIGIAWRRAKRQNKIANNISNNTTAALGRSVVAA